MSGRRVSRKPRRNPLYTLFMSLLGIVIVLLVTVFVLNAKLRSARRDLTDARTKIEQLQKGTSQSGVPDGDADGDADGAEDGANDGSAGSANGDVIDWLDLTGHSEVQVKPASVYDKYYIYYTTGGVNLRGGPSTSYDKITTVSLGTEVQAAAKQDGWTFVAVGGQFGWINSDYLVTTRPAS